MSASIAASSPSVATRSGGCEGCRTRRNRIAAHVTRSPRLHAGVEVDQRTYLLLLHVLREREGVAVLVEQREVGGLVTWLERHAATPCGRERHSSRTRTGCGTMFAWAVRRRWHR